MLRNLVSLIGSELREVSGYVLRVTSRNTRNPKPETRDSKPGFVLLISILAIGVISSVIVSTLLLLGTSAGTFSLSVQQSSQAMAFAQACGEYALNQLRTDPSYSGDQILTIDTGTCEILPVGGIGNNNRLICVEGQMGNVFRRMEIIVSEILPTTRIASWQEVSLFTLCQ